jgi:PPK2 family polyphosphate:nucleotide phosphotransferase
VATYLIGHRDRHEAKNSAFVGRIYDWYRKERGGNDIPTNEDPGVASVTRIYNYFKKFDYKTRVMGASFRKVDQVVRLARCDLFTIRPDLLEQMEGTEPRRLSADAAKASDAQRVPLYEKTFSWIHNEDAIATEKLAEGIDPTRATPAGRLARQPPTRRNMNYSKRFVVEPGAKVKLHKIDPGFIDPDVTEKDALAETKKLCKKLRKLQTSLYSEKQRSVLIVLQALDTAGKDGVINHVLGAMNPLSCRIASFKKPGPEAAAHNYLWRVSIFLPEKGEVVIFNRSHYEDVLVVKVHNLVPKDHASKRYHQLNSFEHYLTDNDTHVLKFFLHISKDEQLRRFKRRLDDPKRHWKISDADYKERKFWDAYIEAYEEALSRCSTERAPWYIIPADCKWFRNLAVARIAVDYLQGLGIRPPQSTVDLGSIRKEYEDAAKEALGTTE